MESRIPNPIDIHVGRQIQLRRSMLGLTQGELGKVMGVSFYQLQKYERGLNRVSASRLWDLSQLLGVDVNFFYDDMPEEAANLSPPYVCI